MRPGSVMWVYGYAGTHNNRIDNHQGCIFFKCTKGMLQMVERRNEECPERQIRSERFGARGSERKVRSERFGAKGSERKVRSESFGAKGSEREFRSETFGARVSEPGVVPPVGCDMVAELLKKGYEMFTQTKMINVP
jgi:hypothetical protein